MKKWTKLMAVALSLVIIASAIVGGIVLADEPATGDRVAPPPMQRGGMAQGSNVLPELLGLTAEEIHNQRLAGGSLVEIAAAQGVSEAELVAALTTGVTDKINQAVTDGKLTQEQADEKLAIILAQTTVMVNNTEMPEPKTRQPKQRQPQKPQDLFQRGFQAGVQTAEMAGLLGLSIEEIHTQRLAGASLLEIAAAQGVSEAELVAALTDGTAERLAQAVTDGKLTQEQADAILAKDVERTTQMINSTEAGQHQMQPRFGQGRTGDRSGTPNAEAGGSQTPNFGSGTRGGFGGNLPRGITA